VNGLQRLEEVRILMNQLMGQGGSLAGGEKRKFALSTGNPDPRAIEGI